MDYLTTEQFIKEVENLGYEINGYTPIRVCNGNDTVAGVFNDESFSLDTHYQQYWNLESSSRERLYNLLDRYARTPLDKRLEEKKYYLKLDVSDEITTYDMYLNYEIEEKRYFINIKTNSEAFQTIFTSSEIDELDKQGITKGFVRVEVDDE